MIAKLWLMFKFWLIRKLATVSGDYGYPLWIEWIRYRQQYKDRSEIELLIFFTGDVLNFRSTRSVYHLGVLSQLDAQEKKLRSWRTNKPEAEKAWLEFVNMFGDLDVEVEDE